MKSLLIIVVIIGWLCVVVENNTLGYKEGVYHAIHNVTKVIGIICILFTFGYIVHVLL